MKILLDECVTKKLKPFLQSHSVFTVSEMKWNGLRNGNLISKAIDEKFDMLLTIDKNLSFQQNVKRYDLILVVFDSPSSSIELLEKYIPAFENKLTDFEKGKVYIL